MLAVLHVKGVKVDVVALEVDKVVVVGNNEEEEVVDGTLGVSGLVILNALVVVTLTGVAEGVLSVSSEVTKVLPVTKE